MKHAGVDVGCSLTKVAFKDEKGAWVFYSTADHSAEWIAERLLEEKITRLNVCGLNHVPDAFQCFEIRRSPSDAAAKIAEEIKLQSAGAKELLRQSGNRLDEFLLVSVGTGTSYTFVNKKSQWRFPVGNPFGGGSLQGISYLMNIADFWELAADLEEVPTLDLLVKDVAPNFAGSSASELVVSSFGKVGLRTSATPKEAAKTLLHAVATAIGRDIAMLSIFGGLMKENKFLGFLGLVGKFAGIIKQKVVIIGTTVARCPALREMITVICQKHLKITPVFPEHGAYALAVGSFLEK